MKTEERLVFLNFFVRSLNLKMREEPENGRDGRVKVDFGLGIANPKIIEQTLGTVALFPLKFDLSVSNDADLVCEFVIGFEVIDKNLANEQNIKELFNNDNDFFMRHISRTVNKIIDNAFLYTSLQLEESIPVNNIYYR